MFVKALCLVAVATAVYAGEGGKPTLKAVAKASKEKEDDGFRIYLDGSNSDRECANARWEIRVGGVYVKIADRMFAKYFVGDKPKTYKFRLTIWDPEDNDRIEYDFVFVEINGGGGNGGDSGDDDSKSSKSKFSKEKGDKLFADADIIKVTELNNGYEIKLTGEDSKNCDEYVWEYKGKNGYEAFSTKENTKFEVDLEGKHKFRLICLDDDSNKVDIDYTWVNIYECKDPKFPSPDDGQGGNGGNSGGNGGNSGGNGGNSGGNGGNSDGGCGKKHCDPCKGVNAKARAEVKNVKEVSGGYELTLTAEGSEDCKTYEWERLFNNNKPNENLGFGETKKYTVGSKGEFKFRVTCYNNKCNDSDKDVLVTDCVATYR